MPPGIPVATVGVNRGDNAGFLAAQILGVAHAGIGDKVGRQRAEAAAKVLEDDKSIRNTVEA